MSDGKLKDVSILDFPAFAYSIGTLERSQKRETGWPTELNFALLQSNQSKYESMKEKYENFNKTDFFTKYKKLLEDWSVYMQKLDSSDYEDYWTDNMANNEYLNFTKYIKQDLKTFLIAVAGIHTLRSQKTLPILGAIG